MANAKGTVDSQQVAKAIVEALDENVVVPDPEWTTLVEEITGCLDGDAPLVADDEATLEAANAIYDTIVAPMLSELSARDGEERPVRHDDATPLEREAADSFWRDLAEQLDEAYGTTLMEDPLTDAPDDWNLDREALVDADLPEPEGRLRDWITARTEATAPCPRCDDAEMVFDRYAWSAHARFAQDGWLSIYHECPACDAKAHAAWRTDLGRVPEDVLEAIEVWNANCWFGEFPEAVRQVLELGARARILDPVGAMYY